MALYARRRQAIASQSPDIVSATRSTVIEEMGDGVIVLDVHDRIVDLNPAARRILGQTDSQAIGRLAAHVLNAWPGLVEHSFGAGKTQTEIALGEGDAWRCYEMRISSIDGRPACFQGHLIVLHDVTERKRLESLREDLVYMMVHDLRNPLGVTYGALEFLESDIAGSLSPDDRQLLEIARDSAWKMLKLVNAILDVSQLESGRMPLECAQVSLETLVGDVLRAESPLVAGKNLRLEWNAPPDLPLAWADIGLIERVLQNLVGNAIKLTPPGGVVCVAAMENGRDRGSQLLVSVSDSGPGIPPEIQARLFQKFAVGRNNGHGNGLGLAFCKMAVEAHGGRIWVESVQGSGTTFTFSLPLPGDGELTYTGGTSLAS